MKMFAVTLSVLLSALPQEYQGQVDEILSQLNVPSRIAGVSLTTYRNNDGYVCVLYPASYTRAIDATGKESFTAVMNQHCSPEEINIHESNGKEYSLPSHMQSISAHVDDYDNTYYTVKIKNISQQ
jgi:hypothetical protein